MLGESLWLVAATPHQLAEIMRRALEIFLSRFPENAPPSAVWKLPTVDGGGIKLPLRHLRDVAADDEASRGLPGR